ncbi:MAG: hypothetical protein U0768_12905 [Anaerolineae bacterium]
MTSAHALTSEWQQRAPSRVEAFEFPAALKLHHDLIDQYQKWQRIEIVYPVLLDYLAP